MNRVRPLRPRAGSGGSRPGGLDGLDPLLARLYAARGIVSAFELDASLNRLAPVGSLTGVERAACVLADRHQRRILVIGDFDADGATSTALVVRCLREFGYARVDYRVPNRFEFGYGLSPELVAAAAAGSPDLLLTVDNGTSSIAGAAEAARLGIDVLITDHHLPGPELPQALAILNPNLPGSGFRSRHLAGVGVAFYLMAALGRLLQDRGQDGAARIPAKYLDLVALGTVADVVPLDRDNRILVSQGLARIRAGRSVPGIAALMNVAGRDPARIVSADLGFAIGPRLNAAGRLEDMSLGIECLLTDDPGLALESASVLDTINSERRDIEATMREQAFAHVDALRDPDSMPGCICVHDDSWHQGVVGLVAARLRERCHRPAIAFASGGDGELKGSARSIPGVHIRDLLEAVATVRPGLIAKFGGHAMAAGLSLAACRLDEFSRLACERAALSERRFQRRAPGRRRVVCCRHQPGHRAPAARSRAVGCRLFGAGVSRRLRGARTPHRGRRPPQAQGAAARRQRLVRCDRLSAGGDAGPRTGRARLSSRREPLARRRVVAAGRRAYSAT